MRCSLEDRSAADEADPGHHRAKRTRLADCFMYRNKIGLDVALEALREYLRSKKRSLDRLTKAAEACRVARVMRPYLEALA
jgi:hypothetical protein